MKNTVSIKLQSQRTTKWMDKAAINVNLIFRNFQMGIKTSDNWGVLIETSHPTVEFQIEGKDYEIPLNEFKALIKDNYHVAQ